MFKLTVDVIESHVGEYFETTWKNTNIETVMFVNKTMKELLFVHILNQTKTCL